MKIALVTDKFCIGGGLENIYQLCSGMPDIEFGVFGKDGVGTDRFKALDNVRVFSDGYDSQTIELFNPDIIHYHHLRPLLLIKKTNKKTIFTVHGIHLHKYEFQTGLISKICRFARYSLEKFLYSKVDLLITVSKDDAVFLEKTFLMRTITIYNGIDYKSIENTTNNKVLLREKLQLPLNKKIFLTVARFDYPKGYDVLIRAICLLKKGGNLGNKFFLFAGDGADLESMRHLAIKLDVHENIVFLGSRSDVFELMKASDIFVLPSRWEGLPITLIEALVSHLPVIASNTYGIANVYREVKENIYLFKNENSNELATMLLNDYSYKSCDLNVFSINHMINDIRKVYFESS